MPPRAAPGTKIECFIGFVIKVKKGAICFNKTSFPLCHLKMDPLGLANFMPPAKKSNIKEACACHHKKAGRVNPFSYPKKALRKQFVTLKEENV